MNIKRGWTEKDSERYRKDQDDFDEMGWWHDQFIGAIKSTGATKDVKRFLSIGAGTGDLELSLANALDAKFDYLEPSEELRTQFKKRLGDPEIAKRVGEVFETTFEDSDVQNRYPLAIAIHSWYFLGLNQTLLEKALDLLEPGGNLVVLLAKADSFQQRMYELVNESEYPYLGILEFRDWVKSLEVDFEYGDFHVPVEADRFIQNDEFTHHGIRATEVLAVKDWNEVSKETRIKIKEEFRNSTKNGYLECQFGWVVVRP